MKKNLFIFFLLLVSLTSFSQVPKITGVSQERAREIMGDDFLSIKECQTVLKNVPLNLPINFSAETLIAAKGSKLVVLLSGTTYRYSLVQIRESIDSLIIAQGALLKSHGLTLGETENFILLMYSLRPGFPFKSGYEKPFTCFFKTKNSDGKTRGLDFVFAVSYGESRFLETSIMVNKKLVVQPIMSTIKPPKDHLFLEVSVPIEADYGLINYDTLAFLIKSDKEKIAGCSSYLSTSLKPGPTQPAILFSITCSK